MHWRKSDCYISIIYQLIHPRCDSHSHLRSRIDQVLFQISLQSNWIFLIGFSWKVCVNDVYLINQSIVWKATKHSKLVVVPICSWNLIRLLNPRWQLRLGSLQLNWIGENCPIFQSTTPNHCNHANCSLSHTHDILTGIFMSLFNFLFA